MDESRRDGAGAAVSVLIERSLIDGVAPLDALALRAGVRFDDPTMRPGGSVGEAGREARSVQRAEDLAVVEVGDLLFQVELGVEQHGFVRALIDICRPFQVLTIKHEAKRNHVVLVSLVNRERGESSDQQWIEV